MHFKNCSILLLFVLSCLLLHFPSYSQSSIPPEKENIVAVRLHSNSGSTNGEVYNFINTVVTASRDVPFYSNNISKNDRRFKTSDYYNKHEVTRVRKGSVLIGAFTGAAIGAIIGLATYQKKNDQLNFGSGAFAAMGGVAGALVGTLVGVIVHKRKV